MKKALFIFCLGLLVVVKGNTQDITLIDSVGAKQPPIVVLDSTKAEKGTQKATKKFYPVPKKALRYSLMLPGLAGGQFYNRDYWKAPFVLAAYGASGYFIAQNLKGYNNLVDGYKKFYDLDPESPNYGKLDPQVQASGVDVYLVWQKRTQTLNLDQTKRIKDYYRKMRDWSYFSVVVVYALAAIEANVAAHMKTFDLTDDLSMKVQPAFIQTSPSLASPGMRIVLTFK